MGRPRTVTNEEILMRATDLFWIHGADSVSTRDLEVAIGLRAPALYRRFPSKHILLARSIDWYVDKVIQHRIRKILQDSSDPMQGLYDFFISTMASHGKEPRLRGCLLANSASLADCQVPEVLDAMRRGWSVIDEAFQSQLERAQQTGQLDPDVEPAAVSQVLVLSCQGLLTFIRAGRTDLRPSIDAVFQMLGFPISPDQPFARSHGSNQAEIAEAEEAKPDDTEDRSTPHDTIA